MFTKELKIIEGMNFINKFGFDISDNKWDFAVYFESSKEEKNCKDDYSKLMFFFANEIIMLNYNENWCSPCKISEFITNYKNEFTKFMNEENADIYKPKSYKEISNDSEDFYTLYLATFRNLVIGNYCDSDYAKLLKYLQEAKVKEGK